MKLSTILQSKQNVTSVTTGLKKEYENIDLLYNELNDLVNDQFKLWYCKSFNKIGVARVIELAGLARQEGKNSKKYFSYLLRKDLKK